MTDIYSPRDDLTSVLEWYVGRWLDAHREGMTLEERQEAEALLRVAEDDVRLSVHEEDVARDLETKPSQARVHIIDSKPCEDPTCYRSHGLVWHVTRPKPPCPNAAQHTPMPEGYLQWHDVARRRAAKGQHQVRCEGCGLFAIWTGGRALPGWPSGELP